MTPLDWLIVVSVLVLAFWGYQQGFLVGLLTLGGFAAGAVLGARLAPALLKGGSESPYSPLVALMGALLIGGIAAVALESLALALRQRVVTSGGARTFDGIGGAVLIAALGLGLFWIAGAAALHTPEAKGLRKDIQRSKILRRLNTILPPSGPILHVLNRIDPTPSIRGPRAQVGPPDPRVARYPGVRRAGHSVVRVLGTACGLGIEGSGWVVSPGLVATNAHVVAGEHDTTVTPPGGGRMDVTPVRYDPHNDLALLRVPGLGVPALSFGPPKSGTPGAVLGYPRNGPYKVTPARLGATQEAISQDSYGRGPVRRRITSLRGKVVSGNSGGPVVDRKGRVLATVFASTTGKSAGGFGVPDAIVRAALRHTRRQVSTGPCAA